MPATIQIHEMSALTTGADKTSGTVRFKDADNATVDLVNPLEIPSAGSIYSYEKQLRAYMEVPPGTQISALKWYSDGTIGWPAGVSAKAKNAGTTYTANAKTEMSGGTDISTYTSASPLDGAVTDAGPWDSVNDNSYIGDLIKLQMIVASTASSGVLTAESWTLAYNEI